MSRSSRTSSSGSGAKPMSSKSSVTFSRAAWGSSETGSPPRERGAGPTSPASRAASSGRGLVRAITAARVAARPAYPGGVVPAAVGGRRATRATAPVAGAR